MTTSLMAADDRRSREEDESDGPICQAAEKAAALTYSRYRTRPLRNGRKGNRTMPKLRIAKRIVDLDRQEARRRVTRPTVGCPGPVAALE